MSDLTDLYAAALRDRDTETIDRLMATRLRGTRPAAPAEAGAAEDVGLATEFGRGLVRGAADTAGSLGTLLKAGGTLVGSDLLRDAGERVARYWSDTAHAYAPSEAAQGSLWDNPGLIFNPHWLTASVAETIPALATAMVPAGAAGRALRVGSTLVGWTPAVALKLARIGAAVTGGAIGGSLQGANTFEEVKRRGGSDEEALQALALMGLASAGLNAVSLGQIFKPTVTGTFAGRAAVSGATQGLTQWLQSPAEAVILGDDWQGIVEAAKRGLNAVPAGIITGAGASVLHGKGQELPEAHRAAVTAAREAMGGPLAAIAEPPTGGATPSPETAAAGEGTRRPPETARATAEPPRPGDTLTVNLKYVDGDRTFKVLTAEINRTNAERLASDRARRGVDEMRAEGHARLPDLEAAMAWDPTTAPAGELPGTLRALADWRDAATRSWGDLIERAVQGDAEARWTVLRAHAIAGDLGARVELGESILGRGLRMQQEVSQGARAGGVDPREVTRLADLLLEAPDVNLDAYLARMQTLKRQAQREVVARQSVNLLRNGQNALYEAWINGLLSGPQTHTVNVLSNTLTALWAVPERGLAAAFSSGRPGGVVTGEAAAMLRGIVEGWTDGLRLAGKAWREFETTAATGTKLDVPQHAITAGAFGLDGADGSVGRAVDLLGAGVRMPGRLMVAADAFFKGINYRMELKALALREAAAEGLTGEALTRRVAQLEANPPAEVKARADQFALLQTFQNDLGTGGEAFIRLANTQPGIRLVLPFIRTPTNIAKWAIYRTPGLNLLSTQYRADLASPGPARELALAKMSMGALTAASVVALSGAGLITGGGPSDPDLKRELRDTGWQPYSLKVGSTYVAYNRLDPVGAVVGLLADSAELIGQIPEPQADNLAAAVVLSVSKVMIAKSYLQGLSDALDAVTSPERGVNKYVQQFAKTLIPTGVRQLTRAIDPTVREAHGILDAIRSGVPGWAETLPPRRNLFGEPVRLAGGLGPDLISPLYSSTEGDDPVAAEIARNRVNLSMPSRVLAGARPPALRMLPQRATEGIELTPQEYDRYVLASADGLREALAQTMASREYADATDGPDGGKALAIRSIVAAYRQGGRARVLAEDSVATRYLDHLERRAAALTVGGLTLTGGPER